MKRAMRWMGAAALAAGVLAVLRPWRSAAQEVDAKPGTGKFFVALNGSDEWSGSLPEPNAARTDGPFATIDRALKEHRKGTIRSTIFVRGGTHHLAQPVTFLPADSGLRLLAHPNERPILSGGRPITGWKPSQNPNIWTVPVTEARQGRWPMRMLRVGNEVQTLARHPNADPANPCLGGWSFTSGETNRVGAFGAALSRIHNPGDWVEWSVRAPVNGDYRLWLLYQSSNRGADLSDRTQAQVDGGAPLPLRGIPDSPVFRWSPGPVATLQLTEGNHIIRWTNLKGGFINLDALIITDDPAWNPNVRGSRPAAGRQAVTVQAETFVAAQCKEMVVPETGAAAFRDRFQFSLGDVKQYRSPQAEIWMFPGNGAANAILRVTRIDPNTRTVFVQPDSSGLELKPGSRYYVANALEELDAPGEWHLDPAGGNLFYWPKSPNFERLGVVAAALDRLIEFKGDPAKNQWVEEVTIRGFQFSDTTWSQPANILLPADAAIWMSGARKCVIERNLFVNLGGHAVRMENRSTGNELVGNHIVDVGQGGVILLGDAASQPQGNLIAGNWMQRLGRVYRHVAGVHCLSAGGTRVAHNRIEQVPRFAIAFQSVDARTCSHNNVAEYNDIQHACMETADTGAIVVTGRHKADTGNVIQFNRILDTKGLGANAEGRLVSPHSVTGIHLGDYASGVTIRGNIVARAPLGAVLLDGGRNNLIENNIFVEGVAQQVLFQVRDSFCEKNRLLKNVFFFSGPAAQLYKHAVQWRPQVLGEVDSNVLWHAQGGAYFANHPVTPLGTFAQWKSAGLEGNSAIAEPGFAEAAKDNYQLQPGSPALQRGFQQIPVEQIGLAGFARSWRP